MSEVPNTPFRPYTTPAGVQMVTVHTCDKCWRTNEYDQVFRDGHEPFYAKAYGRFAVCVCGNEWPLPSRSILA